MKRTDKETELKIVEAYKNGLSMKKIGENFNTNATTVFNILNRHNIEKRTNGGIYKLNEEDIIEKYKKGISSSVIAEKYNVTIHTITNILEKNNIKRDNIYHNIELIENYWENIDSYDKAYFLGFMITDGNVIGNMVRLQLSSKDQYILEKMAEKTKNTNIVKEDKRKMSSFHVKRKKWVDDLSKYGVIPNKTSSVYLPILEDNMMPHLIRGLFDGDGWVSHRGHNIGFCGNERLVTELRDYLVNKLDVFNVKVLQTEPHLWMIQWASIKDIVKIGEFIYKDKKDCYLQRKYDNLNQIKSNSYEKQNK